MLHDAGNVFYSGAIERTTTNIWDEEQPKGFVNYDTKQGVSEFEEITRTRPMFDIDFEEFRETLDGAEGVNAALHNMLTEGQHTLTDALVRLKVDDFPIQERDHIDWALVRSLKGTCLHFYLDIRYGQREVEDLGDRRTRSGGLSLAEEAVAFFTGDEEAVRRCAFGYLEIEADVEEVAV